MSRNTTYHAENKGGFQQTTTKNRIDTQYNHNKDQLNLKDTQYQVCLLLQYAFVFNFVCVCSLD